MAKKDEPESIELPDEPAPSANVASADWFSSGQVDPAQTTTEWLDANATAAENPWSDQQQNQFDQANYNMTNNYQQPNLYPSRPEAQGDEGAPVVDLSASTDELPPRDETSYLDEYYQSIKDELKKWSNDKTTWEQENANNQVEFDQYIQMLQNNLQEAERMMATRDPGAGRQFDQDDDQFSGTVAGQKDEQKSESGGGTPPASGGGEPDPDTPPESKTPVADYVNDPAQRTLTEAQTVTPTPLVAGEGEMFDPFDSKYYMSDTTDGLTATGTGTTAQAGSAGDLEAATYDAATINTGTWENAKTKMMDDIEMRNAVLGEKLKNGEITQEAYDQNVKFLQGIQTKIDNGEMEAEWKANAPPSVTAAQGEVSKETTSTTGTVSEESQADGATMGEVDERAIVEVEDTLDRSEYENKVTGAKLTQEEYDALTPEEKDAYTVTKMEGDYSSTGATGDAYQTDVDSAIGKGNYEGADVNAVTGDAASVDVDKMTGGMKDVAGTLDTEGRAKEGKAVQIDANKAIEDVGFEAATVTAAKEGNFEQYLEQVDTDIVAAQMTAVTGEAAQEVAAQIDMDKALSQLETQPSQYQAVVAALPTEALVTTQMDQLLAGLEGGKTPAWARPAIANVENMLAARGLGKSSIGRDSLFNAIIQSAMPLAQSNAAAIKERANMNLGYKNEAEKFNAQMRQQMNMQVNDKVAMFVGQNAQLRNDMNMANLNARQQMELANLEYLNAAESANMSAEQQARLEGLRAEVDMAKAHMQTKTQFGLANLNNEQAANMLGAEFVQAAGMEESRTMASFLSQNAEWANRMASQNLTNEQMVEELAMKYEADTGMAMTTAVKDAFLANAGWLNQVNMQNTQNKQQASILESEFAQQMNMAENQDIKDYMMQNSEFMQRMAEANLSNEQQAEMLSLQLEFDKDKNNMDADNLAKLEKYKSDVQMEIVSKDIKSKLKIQELSNEQEAAITNAANMLQVDLTEYTAEQQKNIINSKFFQTAQLQELDNEQQAALQNAMTYANMDIRNADAVDRANIENAKNFLAMDLANLDNTQQANILESQQQFQSLIANMDATNIAAQINAKSENDVNMFMKELTANIDKFNVGQLNAMKQFNAGEANDMKALDAELDAAREQFNKTAFNTMMASNIQYMRGINEFNTAAENNANQINALSSFQLGRDAMAAIVQELRDNKANELTKDLANLQAKVDLQIAALQRETALDQIEYDSYGDMLDWVAQIIG